MRARTSTIEITPMVRAVAGAPDAPKALSIRRLSVGKDGKPRRRQFLSWHTGKWVKVPDGGPLPAEVIMEMADRTKRPRRVDPLPGRNDPCLCGSGKKWKHCCGSSKVLGVPKIEKRRA